MLWTLLLLSVELLQSYNGVTEKNSMYNILNTRNAHLKSDRRKNALRGNRAKIKIPETNQWDHSPVCHTVRPVLSALPNTGIPAHADVSFSSRCRRFIFQISVLTRKNLSTQIDGQMSIFYSGIIFNASVKMTRGYLWNVHLWFFSLLYSWADHWHFIVPRIINWYISETDAF